MTRAPMAKDVASQSAAERFQSARRIVIKVGSALICRDDRSVDEDWLAALAGDIAGLRGRGCDVLVVSSGAISVGRNRLGLTGALALHEKQAAAAAGQALLMQAWQNALAPFDLTAAQILLTLDDTEDRRRYLNARSAVDTLLQLGAVPIVNENDTVATTEIRYGDNDRLAAHVAQLASADLLIMLSDIDGLYTADPRKNESADHIERVDAVTPQIEAMAGGINQAAAMGSGGMVTKIAAAKIAVANGCAALIARGDVIAPIAALENGARATLFTTTENPDRERRKWIGGRLKPAGEIMIDAGAQRALMDGKSLLPAGVTAARGGFERGDAVLVLGPDGEVLAQGLSAYDCDEVRKILGRQSSELEAILGYKRRPAVIDRNDLVIKSAAKER